MQFHRQLIRGLAFGVGLLSGAWAAPITVEFTGSVNFYADGPCSVCAHIYTEFTRDSGLSAAQASTITGSFTLEQDATPYPYGGAPGLYGTAMTAASLRVGNLFFTSTPETTDNPDAAYGADQAIWMDTAYSMRFGLANDAGRWWGQSRMGSEHLTSAVNPRMAYYWRDFSVTMVNALSPIFASLDLNDFAAQLDAIDVSALATRNFHAGIELIDPTYPYAVDAAGDALYYHYNPSLSLNGQLTDVRVLSAPAAGPSPSPVPEPASIALALIGLGGVLRSPRAWRAGRGTDTLTP